MSNNHNTKPNIYVFYNGDILFVIALIRSLYIQNYWQKKTQLNQYY